MPRVISSYRARRRLMRGAIVAVVLAGCALLAVFTWNTADTRETFSGGEADVFVEPEKKSLNAAERRELVAVARTFLETAVARNHPERAFEIVGPNMRGAMTVEEWRSGDIPVVPYPVDAARWKIQYAFIDEVGLEVLVFPRKGVELRPQVFLMALVPSTTGKQGWLVDAFSPKGGSPDSVRSNVEGQQNSGRPFGDLEPVKARLHPAWLLAPVVLIVGTLVAVPLVLFLRSRGPFRRRRPAA